MWVLLLSTSLPSAPSKRSVVNLSPFCFWLRHWGCNTFLCTSQSLLSPSAETSLCTAIAREPWSVLATPFKHDDSALQVWGIETRRVLPEKSGSWLEPPVVVQQKSKVQQVLTSAKPEDLRLWWSSISGISMAFCFFHLSYNPVDSSLFSPLFLSEEIKICLLCSIIFIARQA